MVDGWVWGLEVVGSNPTFPTIFLVVIVVYWLAYETVTLEERVQFPSITPRLIGM